MSFELVVVKTVTTHDEWEDVSLNRTSGLLRQLTLVVSVSGVFKLMELVFNDFGQRAFDLSTAFL